MFEIEFSKNFAKNLDKLPTNIVKRFFSGDFYRAGFGIAKGSRQPL